FNSINYSDRKQNLTARRSNVQKSHTPVPSRLSKNSAKYFANVTVREKLRRVALNRESKRLDSRRACLSIYRSETPPARKLRLQRDRTEDRWPYHAAPICACCRHRIIHPIVRGFRTNCKS